MNLYNDNLSPDDEYGRRTEFIDDEPLREPGRWRRRLVRGAIGAVVVLIGARLALYAAVVMNPLPENFLTYPPEPPGWCAADGSPLGVALDAGGRRRYRLDAAAMSPWLAKATEAVEDRRFRDHAGVDWLRAMRAAFDNAFHTRRSSGASTITMQLCRIANRRERTFAVKLDETWLALRLDRAKDKDAQMNLYLNLASYGGNRTGVEAACRAYFGKSARALTLAEAALIAGLPQSPEKLRPDRFPEKALARRETVLRAMESAGFITAEQHAGASREPIPAHLPDEPAPAPQLLRLAAKSRPAGGKLTLDAGLQRDAARLLGETLAGKPENLQGAVVILDLKTDAVLARVGAVPGHRAAEVDHSARRRSPGSALKTFAYARAFEDRRITPETLLRDARLDGFTWAPRNFDGRIRGDVTVAEALRTSLNLPALALTREVGLARAIATATACGVRSSPAVIAKSGLSWVVGGDEVTLTDLTDAYATLGRGGIRRASRLFAEETPATGDRVLTKETCDALDVCLGVSDEHLPAGWEHTDASRRPWFMWKTGTGSAGRDAWSVGHNGRVAIGVWVGSTAGKVREKVASRTHAEPLLATLFSLPRVRNDTAPYPPLAWWPVVTAPVVVEKARILAPARDSTLLATDGESLVYPKTGFVGEVTWFLDGHPLAPAALSPLRLPIGAHELRLVTATGESDAIRITVEDAQ